MLRVNSDPARPPLADDVWGRLKSANQTHIVLARYRPPDVRAVAAKELRYLLRSVLGKFNLIMMPVFVVIVVFFFGRPPGLPDWPGLNWLCFGGLP